MITTGSVVLLSLLAVALAVAAVGLPGRWTLVVAVLALLGIALVLVAIGPA